MILEVKFFQHTQFIIGRGRSSEVMSACGGKLVPTFSNFRPGLLFLHRHPILHAHFLWTGNHGWRIDDLLGDTKRKIPATGKEALTDQGCSNPIQAQRALPAQSHCAAPAGKIDPKAPAFGAGYGHLQHQAATAAEIARHADGPTAGADCLLRLRAAIASFPLPL